MAGLWSLSDLQRDLHAASAGRVCDLSTEFEVADLFERIFDGYPVDGRRDCADSFTGMSVRHHSCQRVQVHQQRTCSEEAVVVGVCVEHPWIVSQGQYNAHVAVRHLLGRCVWFDGVARSSGGLTSSLAASAEGFNPGRADPHLGKGFVDAIGP